VVQILFRNDTEAECSTQELIDWDAAIIAEDRDMLESTDPDAIVDMGRKIEKHMPSDRPGMLMRKRLLELLHAHNEKEQPREAVASAFEVRHEVFCIDPDWSGLRRIELVNAKATSYR
jgi:hypothetical protein